MRIFKGLGPRAPSGKGEAMAIVVCWDKPQRQLAHLLLKIAHAYHSHMPMLNMSCLLPLQDELHV